MSLRNWARPSGVSASSSPIHSLRMERQPAESRSDFPLPCSRRFRQFSAVPRGVERLPEPHGAEVEYCGSAGAGASDGARSGLSGQSLSRTSFSSPTSMHVPTSAPLNPASTATALRPVPYIGSISGTATFGIGNYEALTAKLEKHLSKGLEFISSYTYGHALADTGTTLSGSNNFQTKNDQNIAPRLFERGLGHPPQLHYGSHLPDPVRPRQAVRRQYDSRCGYDSGQLADQRYPHAAHRTAVHGERGRLPGCLGRLLSRTWCRDQFQCRPVRRPHSIAMVQYCELHRPGFADARQSKRQHKLWTAAAQSRFLHLQRFCIYRARQAAVRLEVFNLTNTPQFNFPDSVFGDSNFGRVTSTLAGTERHVQFGLKLAF